MKITFERALEVLEAMGYELEQAEQEPIGMILGGELVALVEEYQTGAWPIYAAPQPVNQKPVAWMLEGSNCVEFEYRDYHDGYEWTPLYAAPARTKDLTDDEIHDVFKSLGFSLADPRTEDFSVARAVIAADREKNK